MKRHVLIREGIPTLLVTLILTAILYWIYPWLVLIGIALILFVLYFFRDPKRMPTESNGVILSAADGLVTDVKVVEEDHFIKGKATRIDIFLSPLNVHVNRSPIAGKVTYRKYQKGKFVPATNPECHEVNEKNYIGIKGELPVLVVQVAGIMARRIVDWTEEGMEVAIGEKIGMIKFSSGTQIYIPEGVKITVKPGDRLTAGITVIGRYS